MKNILVALFLLGTSMAFAYPSDAQMRRNFQTCTQTHESWHRRFGAHVVAFNYNSAVRICNSNSWGDPATPRMAGCRVNGQWLQAGFYCEIKYGP